MPAVHNTTTTHTLLTQTHSRSLSETTGSERNLTIANEYPEQCGHAFTSYIIPSIMHLASYILGFIYFRINENETLYA